MDGIQITKTVGDTKGRFEACVDGLEGMGELTFSRVNPHLIIADHTGVDNSLAGKGVAKALVLHLIADARAHNYRIVPLCPFVRAQADKNRDWDDVIVR